MKKRIRQLDTLRFIGILFIILYHFVPHIYRGGFLGVNIFLILAGYMNGLKFQSPNPDFKVLKSFKRLVGKLYKPLILFILILSSYLLFFNRELINNWAMQILSNLTFINNWYQIIQGASYFDAIIQPSIMTHLWYLSIYVQFILIFWLIQKFIVPLVKSRQVMLVFWISLTLFSALLMAVFYEPHTDPTRVYYGTDTRFFSFGMGVIASYISLDAISEHKLLKRWMSLIQLGLLALVITMLFRITDVGTFTYYGGMLLFDIVFVLLIISLLAKQSLLSHILTFKPIAHLGEHSLGTYLWYYPIYLLIQRNMESVPSWIQSVAIQVILIFVIGYVTEWIAGSHLLHVPLFRWRKRVPFKAQIGYYFKSTSLKQKVALGINTLLVLFTVVSFFFSTDAEEVNRYKQQYTNSAKMNEQIGHPMLETHSKEEVEAYVNQLADTQAFYAEPFSTEQLMQTTQLNATFIGDSIMLGASEGLKTIYPNAIINAEVGRQLYNSPMLIQKMRENNELNYLTVISLGANGSFTSDQFDEFIAEFPDDIDLFFVTTHVNRPWRDDVNTMLREKSEANDRIRIIDWATYSQTIDESILDTDNLHLDPTGRRYWTTYITNELLNVIQPSETTE